MRAAVAGGDQRLAEHDVDQRRVRRELRGLPQRADRLGRLAGFEQGLALELVEIGVLRLRLDQRIDLRDRGARIAEAIGRDGARVAGRQAVVVRLIAPRDPVRPVHEAVELGAREVVAGLHRRRILLVPVRAFPRDALQRGDALARQRMRLHVRAHAAGLVHGLVGEPLEGLRHALGGLFGRGQEFHRRAVGLVFLRADVAEQRVLNRRLRSLHDGGAGVAHARVAGARAGDHRADAEDHRQDRLGRSRRQVVRECATDGRRRCGRSRAPARR